jgi:hypothetical protein
MEILCSQLLVKGHGRRISQGSYCVNHHPLAVFIVLSGSKGFLR